MIDLKFRMSRTGNVLDIANDRRSRYTDLENGAFQETPYTPSGRQSQEEQS
jgi:hypothetical protein